MKAARAIIMTMICLLSISISSLLQATSEAAAKEQHVGFEGRTLEGEIALDTASKGDLHSTVNVIVKNLCPFNLWIHGAGSSGVLQPDDQLLAPGNTETYTAPGEWSAARLEAYKNGPRQNQIEKVEMTFNHNGVGEQVLNYNVTYVDWVGLPVAIGAMGSGGDCKVAGCYKPFARLLDGCPEGLNDGDRCVAARTFCLNPVNSGNPYCHVFDAKIDECADRFGDCQGARGSSTAEVYACSGAFFSQNPKYCAAINRNMLNDPFSIDKKLYYKNSPFNTYAKWVHDICPGLYAFPYDDFPSNGGESGFHSCSGSTQIDVTFCPAG